MNFFAWVGMAVLCVWGVQAYAIYQHKKLSWRTPFQLLCSLMFVVGCLGFVGGVSESVHGFINNKHFEWPVGTTKEAQQFSSGVYVVPVRASGRVQLYTQDLNFIRGWNPHTNGHIFELILSEPVDGGDTFTVYVEATNIASRYTVEGRLLFAQRVSKTPNLKARETRTVTVPTPFYLKSFASMPLSWGLALVGLMGWFVFRFPRKKLGANP